MIYDRLEHAGRYYGLGGAMETGLRLLAESDFDAMDDGRHDIDGDNLYMSISTYTTKPEGEALPEAHREYLDIQYLLQGREEVGVAPLSHMEREVESHPDRDLYFYQGKTVRLPLEGDRFMVFFPQDAHAPCIQADAPGQVRKVVVKIRMSALEQGGKQ